MALDRYIAVIYPIWQKNNVRTGIVLMTINLFEVSLVENITVQVAQLRQRDRAMHAEGIAGRNVSSRRF